MSTAPAKRFGNRGLGRPKGSRNKRTAAIREATERVNGGPDLGPIRQFDSLERQREVASYFLSEAELEKAKAKPNKEQIARIFPAHANPGDPYGPFEAWPLMRPHAR